MTDLTAVTPCTSPCCGFRLAKLSVSCSDRVRDEESCCPCYAIDVSTKVKTVSVESPISLRRLANELFHLVAPVRSAWHVRRSAAGLRRG